MPLRSFLPRRDDAPRSAPANDAAADDPCAGCGACPADLEPQHPALGRRGFLRDSIAAAAAGALLTLGLTRSAAAAMPVRFITATVGGGAGGDTKRYPIPAADGVQIDRDAEVILVRWQGAVYAFALSCPHQNTALRWVESDARFQCPKHHSKYQPDGSFIEGRATRAMDRFSLQRDGADVVVDLDALHKQDADPAGWSAAVVHLA